MLLGANFSSSARTRLMSGEHPSPEQILPSDYILLSCFSNLDFVAELYDSAREALEVRSWSRRAKYRGLRSRYGT
jgi:hypothetical protein